MVREKILVTAALPYANGPIHVGHAIGCYIPADVYVRYHRLKGDDILYICGTDEHGTPITVSAEKEGITPQDVVDKYHKMHEDAFNKIGVQFDNFSGTSRHIHYETSQDFFKTVNENGFIHKDTVERPFCPNCDRFLPDRYVKGTCPNCGSEKERGDQCERCGTQLEPHELIDPYCDICTQTPEMRATTHWFFELSKLGPKLKEWVTSNQVSENLPNNAKNFALGWVGEDGDGLIDRSITRDMSWGIPVPAEDADGKVLYVWFDAPIGYISSTKEWAQKLDKPDEWKKYWLENDTKIVHFIGKDNIPFHIVIWPAMLMAQGEYNLPWQVASNEFLNLEGKKMSTSRGWVIWLHDIVSEFNPDAVRYYLLSIAPETSDSDFYLNNFQERVNNELIANVGNFVHRTLTFIKSKNEGVIPTPKEFEKQDKDFQEIISNQIDMVGQTIDKFQQTSALAKAMTLAQEGNKYFQGKEPWKNENETTLYLCANLVRTLSIVFEPFLPKTSEKIWKMLSLPGSVHEQNWEDAKKLDVPPEHKLGEIETLFDKIEDEDIDNFSKKYLPQNEKSNKKKKEKTENKQKNNKKINNNGEKKMTITYEEFSKLDLKTGEIIKADDHPNADKLFVLQVDIGEENPRQLVAGIKEGYSKEELIGKQIIVVANLDPAKIRGVESQGMVLAAQDEDKILLLTSDKKTKPGSTIR